MTCHVGVEALAAGLVEHDGAEEACDDAVGRLQAVWDGESAEERRHRRRVDHLSANLVDQFERVAPARARGQRGEKVCV